MSLESFLPKDTAQMSPEALIQEVLFTATENENVIEIVDFDFLRHGVVIPKTFDLGSEGKIDIAESHEHQRTHRLIISNIPPENEGKIFIIGFPYIDSSRYDEAENAIWNQQSEEENDVFYQRLGNNSSFSMPERPSSPSFHYGDSLEANQRKLDQYKNELKVYSDAFTREIDAYNRQKNERAERERREDREITRKYERMRMNINIESEVKQTVAFFSSLKSEDGNNLAVLDFQTGVSTASLYLPYKPLSFDAFKDKSTLQLFLAYLSKEEQSVTQWAEYFSKNVNNFPIQARLAISSKIQTLGGKIE